MAGPPAAGTAHVTCQLARRGILPSASEVFHHMCWMLRPGAVRASWHGRDSEVSSMDEAWADTRSQDPEEPQTTATLRLGNWIT